MKTALLFISTLFLICNTTFSQDSFKPVIKEDARNYQSKIDKVSETINTLQCSFIQNKEISVLEESVISKGKLLFKKQNKLCWEYKSPYYYLFILNGEKVFIKNETSINQFDTKSNALFKEISLLLLNSISGTGMIDPEKFVVSFFENSESLLVKLAPKNKTIKSILSSISLYFDKGSFLVSKIELTEASGDITTIVFSEVKLNQTINDELFIVH